MVHSTLNPALVSQRAVQRLPRWALLLFCAAYVFGCAFRSFLPRADVQRICLFDTWLSSAFIGRSVATVAEVSAPAPARISRASAK